MFRTLLAGGLFAGLAAGIVAAILQFWLTVPLILEAELYETGTLTHFAAPPGEATDHDTAHGAAPAAGAADKAAVVAAHEAAHEAGSEGLARHALTLSADLVTWAGFGVFLSIAIALALGRGQRIDWRRGAVWGLGGYLAVSLLPAAGLAPELPGSVSAELPLRQAWWTATVLASVAGLWLLAFGRGWPALLAGALLILAPHLVGAPQPEMFGGVVPPELQGEFAARALVVNAASWVVLGIMAGLYWSRRAPAQAG